VKVYDLGYVGPGSRVGFAAAFGSTNTSMVLDGVTVVAVDHRNNSLTVEVTPEQVGSLAMVQGTTLILAADEPEPAVFPWIRRLFRW
jgi:hypothetical protein